MTTIKQLRLKLANWIWPKEVKQGELFTIIRHLRSDGQPSTDGSWCGDTLRADVVDGDRISFSTHDEHMPGRFYKVSHWLIVNQNCIVRPIASPIPQDEQQAIYKAAKQRA